MKWYEQLYEQLYEQWYKSLTSSASLVVATSS